MRIGNIDDNYIDNWATPFFGRVLYIDVTYDSHRYFLHDTLSYIMLDGGCALFLGFLSHFFVFLHIDVSGGSLSHIVCLRSSRPGLAECSAERPRTKGGRLR